MTEENKPSFHVGVLVDTDDSWGRNIVESVCRYAHENNWTLLIAPRDEQGRLRLPKAWDGHGVIASLRHRSMARHLKNKNLPIVDVSLMLKKEDWFARVATDDTARAKLAFDHLRSRGISHFACYDPSIGRYSDIRSQAFQKVVNAEGFPCSIYSSKNESSGWLTNYSQARQWLAKFPKPLGVFAADPYTARQLIEICSTASFRVPEEISILSGDDDDLLCSVASPRISSIELACHQLGTYAAEILDRMMKGSKTPKSTQLIPPLRVRPRQSTDILAIEDEEIAGILQFIRHQAITGITVSDVLRQFPISRRTLEQRFRTKLNRSPAEEIRRVRLQYVCQQLLDTDKSIAAIANESGFSSGASLSQTFQKNFHQTPGQFRNSRS